MRISVLGGGCKFRHPGSFVLSKPYGLRNYVLNITRTPSEYSIDGKDYLLEPGTAVLLSPHTPHSYRNPDGEYEDDWIHFLISPEDADLLSLKEISDQPFPVENLAFYNSMITQIMWEKYYGSSSRADENIAALFRVLINHLKTAYENRSRIRLLTPYRAQLRQIRLDIMNNIGEPHTIRQHADEIGISDSYFQHLYREIFGISFQQDLIRMRVETAEYLLRTTQLSAGRIAEFCGYSSEVHFYRQFRQVAGMTPKQYQRRVASTLSNMSAQSIVSE